MVRSLDGQLIKIKIAKRKNMWSVTWYKRIYIRDHVYEYDMRLIELYKSWDAAVESVKNQYGYMEYVFIVENTLQAKL